MITYKKKITFQLSEENHNTVKYLPVKLHCSNHSLLCYSDQQYLQSKINIYHFCNVNYKLFEKKSFFIIILTWHVCSAIVSTR